MGHRRHQFATEQELAAVVLAWLQECGWDCYQEVRPKQFSPVADIVAVLKPVVWVIETKLTMGLAVLEQAHRWRGMANRVSVATPVSSRRGATFACEVCKVARIGWIQAGPFSVEEVVAAPLNRRVRLSIAEFLHAGHKACAAAGSSRGGMWTPWRQTCINLEKYVRDHPGCTMKEAIDAIEHHYAKATTAKTCMSRWLSVGKVPGIDTKREGRFLRLYPEVAVVAK